MPGNPYNIKLTISISFPLYAQKLAHNNFPLWNDEILFLLKNLQWVPNSDEASIWKAYMPFSVYCNNAIFKFSKHQVIVVIIK